MATILKVWHKVKNLTPSVDAYIIIYLKNNRAKFHPDLIWNDFDERCPTTTRWVAMWDQFLIKKIEHNSFHWCVLIMFLLLCQVLNSELLWSHASCWCRREEWQLGGLWSKAEQMSGIWWRLSGSLGSLVHFPFVRNSLLCLNSICRTSGRAVFVRESGLASPFFWSYSCFDSFPKNWD